LSFIKNHLFSNTQIIILFEEFRVPIFLYAFIKKLQFSKLNKTFTQSLINFQ